MTGINRKKAKCLDRGAGFCNMIDKMNILVTVGFSAVVFKEKLSAKAGAGLAMMVGATLLLAFFK